MSWTDMRMNQIREFNKPVEADDKKTLIWNKDTQKFEYGVLSSDIILWVWDYQTDWDNYLATLNAAIIAAKNSDSKTLYIKEWTYQINWEVIKELSEIKLIWLGRLKKCVFKNTGTGTPFYENWNAGFHYYIENIVFDSNNVNAKCIAINQFATCILKNVEGINANGTYFMSLWDCWNSADPENNLADHLSGLLLLENFGLYSWNTWTHEGVLMSNIDRIEAKGIYATEVASSTTSAFWFYVGCKDIQISGFFFENTLKNRAIDCTGVYNFQIDNYIIRHSTDNQDNESMFFRNTYRTQIGKGIIEHPLNCEAYGIVFQDWALDIDGHTPPYGESWKVDIDWVQMYSSFGICFRTDWVDSNKRNSQDMLKIQNNTIRKPKYTGIRFWDNAHPMTGNMNLIYCKDNSIELDHRGDYAFAFMWETNAKLTNVFCKNNDIYINWQWKWLLLQNIESWIFKNNDYITEWAWTKYETVSLWDSVNIEENAGI